MLTCAQIERISPFCRPLTGPSAKLNKVTSCSFARPRNKLYTRSLEPLSGGYGYQREINRIFMANNIIGRINLTPGGALSRHHSPTMAQEIHRPTPHGVAVLSHRPPLWLDRPAGERAQDKPPGYQPGRQRGMVLGKH